MLNLIFQSGTNQTEIGPEVARFKPKWVAQLHRNGWHKSNRYIHTALMSRHSELFLDISSHTDSRASMKYNEKLSERRARSATKYLDGNGVDDARINSAWYSETRLLNDCGDGVPCPLSYHDINRRSELVLRVFEDRSKEYALPMGAKASDFATPESARKWFSQK